MFRLSRWNLFAVPAAMVAALAVVPAQQQPPIRSGVNYVNVDVYPRRADGRIADGLARQDFQLFEDGVAQTIDSFELIRFQTSPPDAERRDPNTQAEGDREAADPRRRVFVVYLDLFHVDLVGSHDARSPIVNFLTRTIGASDLFAVMTPDRPVSQLLFGRRTETIESQLATYWTWGQSGDRDRIPVPARTAEERAIAHACAVERDPGVADRAILLHREDRLMSNLEALVERLRVLREARTHVLFISQGWVPRAPVSEVGLTPEKPTITTGLSGRLGLGDPRNGGASRSACSAATDRLTAIDFDERFRELLTSAAQANVSFHPLDVGGLTVNVPFADAALRLENRDARARAEQRAADATRGRQTLRTLAEQTEGTVVVHTNDLAGGAAAIAEATSAYYLLGYASTNATPDGKFRRIEVKARPPGLRVTARRGYVAATAAPAPSSRPTMPTVPVPIAAALARLAPIATSELFAYAVSGPAGLDVVAEIAGAIAERPAWRGGADLHVTVVDATGASRAGSARLETGVRSAIVHIAADPASTGPWRITVRAVASAEQLEQRLEIPADAATLVTSPIVYRAAPGPRGAARPAAELLFSRRERLQVEWRQRALLDRQGVRLLDRRGQPLAGPLTPRADRPGPGGLLTVDVPLASLAPGDYLLELSVVSGPRTEQDLVPFRVVP